MDRNIFKLLGQKFTIKLLESLAELPKRYSQLSDICSNDRTMSLKLRELEKNKLIETALSKDGKKSFIVYKLTEKGIEIMERVD